MTHHPNTPASSDEEAVETMSKMEVEAWRRALLAWRDTSPTELSDNPAGLKKCLSVAAQLLLDHPTLAAPASRTEQAAPSVASGASLPKGALGTLSNVIATLREYGRFDDEEGDATDILDDLHEWLQALAAPSAAIAAREQEASEESAALNGAVAGLQAALIFLDQVRTAAASEEATATGASRDAREWLESAARSLIEVLSTPALASRPEAPPASASPATVAQPVELTDEMLLGTQVWFDRKDVKRVVSAVLTHLRIPKGPLNMRLNAAQPCASQGCGGTGMEAVRYVPFNLYEAALPEASEHSTSYGGQWSSAWCVVITPSGNTRCEKFTVSELEKEMLDRGERPHNNWHKPGWPPRYLAWAYCKDVLTALSGLEHVGKEGA